ncbi:MAG TPA: ABC-type transport auxiliary lipoprotein family protein [Candidatus Acidoferrum sp.]|nr:ABC-type transport auxiliary lipoprotein family protein [Candidatus Acidoferrum sp.]
MSPVPRNIDMRELSELRMNRTGFSRLSAWMGSLAFFLLIAGALSGCGAARAAKYYQLTVPTDAGDVEKPGSVPVRLLLGGLTTSHLYREDRIVYGNGPEQLGTYEFQRWAEPPAEMIQEILLRELRATGHYRAVHMRRSNVTGDFAIRGRLYDFKELEGGALSTRVTMEFEMRDLKSGATVWNHYYTHDEPATGKDVPAIVAALDKNVQHGVKEVVDSLEQYFASHPAK